MTKSRRVVVTGMGCVTPLGLDMHKTWDAVLAGKSGVGMASCDGLEHCPVKISASVKDFDPTPYMHPKLIKKADMFIQYGFVASKQAIDDAGLDIPEELKHRVGVALGSGIGGLPLIEKSHSALLRNELRKISPMFIPGVIINMLAGHLSIEYGFRGPNLAIVTACTSGTHNIGVAARTIAYGDADVMIAGGSEMATCYLGLIGFSAMRALSRRNDEPHRASRPWDRDRDGFILGDGAGTLVLEEYEFAKKRGAKIYAELAGFGMSADAFHMTMPHKEGLGSMASMNNAIVDAGLNLSEVNYLNAHATSTPAGDVQELLAIRQLFKDDTKNLAISSTKSMTGHLLGAAGAVEAILSVLAIRDQVAPPTINLDNPEEGLEDFNLVAHQPQQRKINVVLSNSLGFGGTNGSLVFKKFEG